MKSYKKEREFYDSYTGKKCTKALFLQRIQQRGKSMEEAIWPRSLRIKAKRISFDWRDCSQCKQFKQWTCFPPDKQGEHGHCADCYDCRNARHRKLREKPETREKEILYKRERSKSEESIVKRKLDNIFYTDKTIKKNRSILKNIKKISPEQSREAKIEFLLNKGYELEFLQKVYKVRKEIKIYT